MKTQPAPGTKIRLTGKFLKNTGQQRGGEGQSRWTVVKCDCGLCKGGQHVATDEKYDEKYRREMWGDLPEAERPKYRHLGIFNIEVVGKPSKAEDLP